jgi:putative ABC transport system substrate-binding protein
MIKSVQNEAVRLVWLTSRETAKSVGDVRFRSLGDNGVISSRYESNSSPYESNREPIRCCLLNMRLDMLRREFLAVMSGAAATWPLAASAQQANRIRRIGVLMGYADTDAEAKSRLAEFIKRLAALGWTEGHNLIIDARWSAGDVNIASTYAKEMVALEPEVILSNTTPVTAALKRETRTIPIVFTVVSDPVGSGFVESLPHPGGNITGFINLESSLVEKWLELLKEVAPQLTRVAIMFNPQTAPYAQYYLGPLEKVAPSFGVRILPALVQSEADIENFIVGLGRESGGGLIVMTDSLVFVHRKLITALAMSNKIPTMHYVRSVPAEGGLISYGVDYADLFQGAAVYVDRILRGMKPAELPVQVPTKYELVINLKTAKALGLDVPQSILLRANEVIE